MLRVSAGRPASGIGIQREFLDFPTNSDQFRPLSDRFPIHLCPICEFFVRLKSFLDTCMSLQQSQVHKLGLGILYGDTTRVRVSFPDQTVRNCRKIGKSSENHRNSDRFPTAFRSPRLTLRELIRPLISTFVTKLFLTI